MVSVEHLKGLSEALPLFVACLVATNMVLSAAHKGLDKVVHMTESKQDDKAWAFIGKLADWSKKLIDLIGMNPQHK